MEVMLGSMRSVQAYIASPSLCRMSLRPPDLRSIISCSPVTNRCCFTAGSEKCFHWFPLRLLGSCRWSDYAGLVSAISKRMNADR